MLRATIFTILMLLLITPAIAQDCIRYDDFIRSIGELETIASIDRTLLVGDLLYAGADDGTLYVIDVTSASSPTLIGEVFVDAVHTWSLAADGDYIYMGVGGELPGIMSKIHVIDVSVPSNPTVVSSALANDWPRGMEVVGDLLFVACNGDGLRIFTLAYPGSLIQIGQNWIPGYSHDVAVYGNHAYVTKLIPSDDIAILDIEDPTAPVVIAGLPIPEQSLECLVADSHLYVAAGDAGLRVYSLAVPELPEQVGDLLLDLFAPTQNIEIVGTTLFATGSYYSMYVIDISVPSSATVLSILETGHHSTDVSASADYCFISERAYGVHSYDVNPGVFPEILASASTPWYPLDIESVGTTAYVIASHGLMILDVTGPGTYDELAALSMGPAVAHEGNIVVNDGFAYTTSGSFGGDPDSVWVRVLDVADPGDPVLRGEAKFYANYIYDIDYANGHLFVANSWNTRIIDVNDPDNPLVVGSISGIANEIDIHGELLFAARRSGGLGIYDITTPAAPVLVGSYEASQATGVLVDVQLVYLTTVDEGLILIDTWNPADPMLITYMDAPRFMNKLIKFGDNLYAHDNGYMTIYAVHNSSQLTFLGAVSAPDDIGGFAGFPDFIVGASGNSGLSFFAYQCDEVTAVPGTPAETQFGPELAAWPNPFNPHTTLSFSLPAAGNISLDLFDVSGRLVRHLAGGAYSAGEHFTVWQGLDDAGKPVASGVYFSRLSLEDGAVTGGKLVLVR